MVNSTPIPIPIRHYFLSIHRSNLYIERDHLIFIKSTKFILTKLKKSSIMAKEKHKDNGSVIYLKMNNPLCILYS